MNPFFAFVLTLLEAILTLLGLRAAWRLTRKGWERATGAAGARGTRVGAQAD
jgi:hypothetical protein